MSLTAPNQGSSAPKSRFCCSENCSQFCFSCLTHPCWSVISKAPLWTRQMLITWWLPLRKKQKSQRAVFRNPMIFSVASLCLERTSSTPGNHHSMPLALQRSLKDNVHVIWSSSPWGQYGTTWGPPGKRFHSDRGHLVDATVSPHIVAVHSQQGVLWFLRRIQETVLQTGSHSRYAGLKQSSIGSSDSWWQWILRENNHTRRNVITGTDSPPSYFLHCTQI